LFELESTWTRVHKIEEQLAIYFYFGLTNEPYTTVPGFMNIYTAGYSLVTYIINVLFFFTHDH